MGQKWDSTGVAFDPETWVALLRVAKPGAHLLAFGSPRTYHRMASAIEDGGWELRDSFVYLHGQGFPKSHDVSKGIDKILGAEREVVASTPGGGFKFRSKEPITDVAKRWEGWGTAAKPAFEPIVWAQAPYQMGHSAIIDQNLTRLENDLCRHNARSAVGCSRPTLRGSGGEKGDSVSKSVPTNTAGLPGSATQTGRVVATNWGAATSESTWGRESIGWNTISSWKSAWDAISQMANKSTTETPSGLTTDLKILSCCLSQITAECIIQAETQSNGSHALVSSAALLLNAIAMKLSAIHSLSALESASGCTPADFLAGATPPHPDIQPIVLARAPLSEKTVAANVLRWGTGALNIDATRIGTSKRTPGSLATQNGGANGGWGFGVKSTEQSGQNGNIGRWPANVVLDEEGARQLDAQSGMSKSAGGRIANISKTSRIYGNGKGLGQDITPEEVRGDPGYGDVGGPSRFMYVAKASKSERGEGNIHPTCKPVTLMRWLVRLVTPPNGIVLDPFCGSGSTGVAALQEGFRFVGIDAEPSYVEIAKKRLAAAEAKIVEVKDATPVT